jgi:hypothetical protein
MSYIYLSADFQKTLALFFSLQVPQMDCQGYWIILSRLAILPFLLILPPYYISLCVVK